MVSENNSDDIAFIETVKFVDYNFTGRYEDKIFLNIRGTKMNFKIIQTFPFDPYRKKMSILVKNSLGMNVLYMKGADNVVMPLIETTETKR